VCVFALYSACDAATRFRCGSDECKPLCNRCDGQRDCADSSDEFNCSTFYTDFSGNVTIDVIFCKSRINIFLELKLFVNQNIVGL